MKRVNAPTTLPGVSKFREYILCIISAALLILSFPNYNLWLFAWFGFVPLFFAIENKSKAKAFLLAYLTGVVFWWGVIYWLVHVTLPGTILLILYLALYFGVFGLVIFKAYLLPATYYLLLVSSSWVLLEYLRSHLFTGFPWALLGYSQYLNLPIIQIADITGAWGVSFLVMLVNVIIYKVIGHRLWVIGKRQKIHLSVKPFILTLFFIFFCLIYGIYKLYLRPNTYDLRPIRISVIQGNIPQELKWNPRSKDFIINRYFALTLRAAEDKPDLIIWPEAALPVVLEEEPRYYEKVVNFIKDIRIPLLLGAVTAPDAIYYNSALLVSGEGRLLKEYRKLHLVPFGEYIPLRKTFSFLETVVPIGDFTSGKEYTVFTLPAKFSVLICFEDLFPGLARNFIKKGADLLVNITNDAWFGKTSAACQHLAASVFRAAENRVFLLRCANTGISGFIAPNGKIISLVTDETGENIFIEGYKTKEIVIPERRLTFYTRYGDIFIIACLLLVWGILVLSVGKSR